jgi:PAS domain S-box-containing protein
MSATVELEAALARLIDAHVDGVLVTDARLEAPGPHILHVNSGFTRIFGYEPEEVLGRTPRMFHGPGTERAVLDRLRASLARGEPFAGTMINYKKDGSSCPLSWSISPLTQPGGTTIGFVAYHRHDPRGDLGPKLVGSEAALRGMLTLHIEGVAERRGLSRREREVLDLLLRGMTHAAIANALGITARTVKYHQERLFMKLGAESRVDLFRVLL